MLGIRQPCSCAPTDIILASRLTITKHDPWNRRACFSIPHWGLYLEVASDQGTRQPMVHSLSRAKCSIGHTTTVRKRSSGASQNTTIFSRTQSDISRSSAIALPPLLSPWPKARTGFQWKFKAQALPLAPITIARTTSALTMRTTFRAQKSPDRRSISDQGQDRPDRWRVLHNTGKPPRAQDISNSDICRAAASPRPFGIAKALASSSSRASPRPCLRAAWVKRRISMSA